MTWLAEAVTSKGRVELGRFATNLEAARAGDEAVARTRREDDGHVFYVEIREVRDAE